MVRLIRTDRLAAYSLDLLTYDKQSNHLKDLDSALSCLGSAAWYFADSALLLLVQWHVNVLV